ncbi:MAG: RagB/SusD family nutrient uptake outer membrane protein, partial [Bacteroides graminisolvens]|nr:RagB/SusD family nutrient uptake outer membrane protein [Bacteroides graminisolvens]
ANKRAAMHFLAKTYLARGYETFADSNDFTNAAQYAEKAINGEKPTIAFSDVFSINNEENDENHSWSVQYRQRYVGRLEQRR